MTTTSHSYIIAFNQNDTRNATSRHDVDPLQTTLLGKLLQLFWLVPSLVLILSLNCLFLVAILRTKKLWRPRFVLPASLCVLDIVQGSLFIPSSVVNIVMGGNNNPAWFCWIQASYLYVGAVCTLSTLTLMAWDRYQAICNALHYQMKGSLRCLCLKIAASWTFSALLGVVYVTRFYGEMKAPSGVSVAYPFCTLLELSLLPGVTTDKRFTAISITYETTCIVMICLSYGKVYLETKRHQGRHIRNFELPHRRTDNAITYRGRKIMLITKRVALLVYMTVPCFSNPIIYGLNSKDVKQAVARICGIKVKRWTRRNRNIYEVSRPRALYEGENAVWHHKDVQPTS
ncbi:olfactory receptor 14K1-like [Branchiostoma floridae]|uniref:Olfactory receptor 14K1-like n=1 Tax=Branchiostoma floridae TaxID=7739 RepID=A0A9J7MDC9_BRAFL|nr:olfactory receptor 14K1-like [Branchiostoma floridae]